MRGDGIVEVGTYKHKHRCVVDVGEPRIVVVVVVVTVWVSRVA